MSIKLLGKFRPTLFLTLAAAQVITGWCAPLKLHDLFSHRHVGSGLIQLPLIASGEVEGLGDCGALMSL